MKGRREKSESSEPEDPAGNHSVHQRQARAHGLGGVGVGQPALEPLSSKSLAGNRKSDRPLGLRGSLHPLCDETVCWKVAERRWTCCAALGKSFGLSEHPFSFGRSP